MATASEGAATIERIGPSVAAARHHHRVHTSRFLFIASIFVVSQILILSLSWTTIYLIDVARAYAQIDEVYSETENAALSNLREYILTNATNALDGYERASALAGALRTARAALEEPQPDVGAAAAAFDKAGVNPADSDIVIGASLHLREWLHFVELDEWRNADVESLASEAIANSAYRNIQNDSGRLRLIASIDRIGTRLIEARNASLGRIGDGARKIKYWAVAGLAGSSLFLWTVGIFLVWRVYRQGYRSESQLIKSEQRFKDFAEISSDWLWQMDGDYEFVYLTERFGEASGKAIDKWLAAGMASNRARQLAAAWRTANPHFATKDSFKDFRFKFERGIEDDRVWSLSGKPMFSERGSFVGFFGTASDVTVEVKAAEALAEAKSEAEAANRAKSEFLANMSHELRTPLNAILGYSEIIKDEIFGSVTPPRYREYAGDIYRAGQHLLSLINDILDLSKIVAGKVELEESTVDLVQVANWAQSLMQERIDKGGLSCRLVHGGDLPSVAADERRIKQVFVNLLSNAVKFTPKKGRIEMKLHLLECGDVECAISDSGIGIAEADIERALAPFVQVGKGRGGEGTGLGLSLTKSIIELHGGIFSLKSTLGVGTTITFVFPKDRIMWPTSREDHAA